MASFKDPSFQDRTATARDAKAKALALLKAKPPVDPAVLAERQAARLAKEAAEAEARIARKAAQEIDRAEKKRLAEEAAAAAVKKPLLDAAALKAARDARYAARKSRK
jgi:hypothetical protein